MEVVREAYCPMLENILGNSSFYVPTAIGKSDSLLVNIDHGSKTDNRILKGNIMADPANAPGTSSSLPLPSPISIFNAIHFTVVRRLRLTTITGPGRGGKGTGKGTGSRVRLHDEWLPTSEFPAIAWRPEELRRHYDELIQRP